MSPELSSDDAPDLESIVGALDDDGCRRIVAVLDEPLTVDEIADAADLPRSTTYRKLDRLTDASLVTETAGGLRGPDRKARYVSDVDRIRIDLDEDRELRAVVSRATNRAVGIWSDLRQHS